MLNEIRACALLTLSIVVFPAPSAAAETTDVDGTTVVSDPSVEVHTPDVPAPEDVGTPDTAQSVPIAAPVPGEDTPALNADGSTTGDAMTSGEDPPIQTEDQTASSARPATGEDASPASTDTAPTSANASAGNADPSSSEKDVPTAAESQTASGDPLASGADASTTPAEAAPESEASGPVADVSTSNEDASAQAKGKAASSSAPTPGKVAASSHQPAPSADKDAPALADLVALLRDQQKELAATRKLVESQQTAIVQLREELDAIRGGDAALKEASVAQKAGAKASDTKSEAAEIVVPDVADQPVPGSTKDDLPEAVAATAKDTETVAQETASVSRVDDPTEAVMDEFPGSWRLPGTNAALKVGGYVRASLVWNMDPLAIQDRFIVGSIPPDDLDTNIQEQTTVTANMSRLNFDLREPTEFGTMRAFIEGDFRGSGDTFRLRHAFGQWRRVLAGKTWSSFVDRESTPEEVDFEGLNGRINVRQAVFRVTPRIGRDYQFQLSLEDPAPSVTNGNGVSRFPDLIATARMDPTEQIHMKLALIARQIRATPESALDISGQETATGYGVSVSGRAEFPRFGSRDAVFFQLNAGKGIGRYVNDLSSVGAFDGVIDPATGDMELIDVFAGFASYQHWWGPTARSNLTFGWVDLDNPNFVEDSFYRRTLRGAVNYMWTPMPRMDLGAEFLWGERENEDGGSGDATQIQLAARYLF